MAQTAGSATQDDAAMTTLEERLQRGYAAQRAKNTQLAEQNYREVLDVHPDHPDALHYLGLLLCDRGDRATGEPLVRRSIELTGDRANFFNNLGIVLAGVDDLEGASEAFCKAAQLAPNHPDYH